MNWPTLAEVWRFSLRPVVWYRLWIRLPISKFPVPGPNEEFLQSLVAIAPLEAPVFWRFSRDWRQRTAKEMGIPTGLKWEPRAPKMGTHKSQTGILCAMYVGFTVDGLGRSGKRERTL